MRMMEGLTSRVIHTWLWVEKVALGMLGRQVTLDRLVVAPRNDKRHECSKSTDHDDSRPLTATPEESSTSAKLLRLDDDSSRRQYGLYFQNVSLLLLVAALIGYYAFVHVYLIQTEDAVFLTTWFYEWFMIPVLLTFSFCAPLHEALGVGNCRARRGNSNNTSNNDGAIIKEEEDASVCTRQQRTLAVRREQHLHRVELLQRDPATRRLVVAVVVCYVVYVVGDASFFIPLSPNDTQIVTCIIYLLAVLTNMSFIYQGFFLAILTMRAMVVRLHELESSVDTALQQQTLAVTPTPPPPSSSSPSSLDTSTTDGCAHRQRPKVDDVPREQLLEWVQHFQELRDDMQMLSNRFGLRMAIGITMFVVEASNMIINVWEAVGSSLTRQQTVLLLLMYAANAAVLIMTTFQAAYTVTLCTERIGPSIALLSLRTTHSPDRAAELNVLAQTCMQAPIRLRVGNFHITGDYANALTAWFFGLFLVVFGMKLPTI